MVDAPQAFSAYPALPCVLILLYQLFAKHQRVAPRGKPWSVQAKAVVGRKAQNGRNERDHARAYERPITPESQLRRVAQEG